jgi:hypothetical protein
MQSLHTAQNSEVLFRHFVPVSQRKTFRTNFPEFRTHKNEKTMLAASGTWCSIRVEGQLQSILVSVVVITQFSSSST